MLEKNTDLSGIKGSAIMSRNPKYIEKDEFAVKALHQMQEGNIPQLPVMVGARVVGFVHLHDLLSEGIV